MSKIVTLNIAPASLSFAAGHFTILSPTSREHLHGHNYSVTASLTATVGDNGMSFDYRDYKDKLAAILKPLNQYFLLPSNSPYLRIEDADTLWLAHFQQEIIPLLKTDVVILPITNITLEELAHWLLEQFTTPKDDLTNNCIHKVRLTISNGPGYSATAKWKSTTR